MKKLLLILLLIFALSSVCCAETNYRQIYSTLEPADFSYVHGIDPDQFYDLKDNAWAPYPLFRLNSTLYFKGIKIEPGYYLLTPREHKGKWYVLFKDNGKVKYTIPCYNRDIVPELFYKENLPQEKLTMSQKIHIGFVDLVSKVVRNAKRKMPPQTYLEADDIGNEFLSLIIYYGNFKYYLLLRTNPM